MGKAWASIVRMSIIWKTDKIKREFFLSITTLELCMFTPLGIKWNTRRKNGNYSRMLCAIFNKNLKQHSTKQWLYVHLVHITRTIHLGQTRHAGHCWRMLDELISDIFLWTPTYGPTSKKLHSSTLCRHWITSREAIKDDRVLEWMEREWERERERERERESQRNLCCRSWQVFLKNKNNCCNLPIGLVGRVFANHLGEQGSISGRVIPKSQNGTWYALA